MIRRTVIREASILFYRNEDDAQFQTSLQVQINGTLGTIHSLDGLRFYQALKAEGFGMFRELGLTRISVAVTPPHLELIRAELGDVVRVETRGLDTIAGRSLIRVEMTEK